MEPAEERYYERIIWVMLALLLTVSVIAFVSYNGLIDAVEQLKPVMDENQKLRTECNNFCSGKSVESGLVILHEQVINKTG